VPKPSAFEFEMATEKLKRHKSPGIDQIPAEFITSGSRIIHSEIHNLINNIWNKGELPVEWKESSTVPAIIWVIKQSVVILEVTTYKILSNALLSRLSPYAEEIIGDQQCGFQCNRSKTDHTF
jgi:hypothetical protein